MSGRFTVFQMLVATLVFACPASGADASGAVVQEQRAGGVAIQDIASLLDNARVQNPQIRAAEARYQAMRQRPIQERTLPDPTVGVRYHNESFDQITFGESDFTYLEFSAEQEVPFPGKLGLRGTMAEREAEREKAMRDETTAMVLAKVAMAYADLAGIDRSIAILSESAGAFELMTRQAAESYGVGAAAQADVLRATLERGELRERVTMLQQKRVAAEAAINALLARAPSESVPPATLPDTPPPFEPLETWLRRLDDEAPAVRAAREDVLRSDVALELAEREYYPDFAVMGAYSNKDGLLPEWELGVKVRLPLYFWRRQRAAVAEAVFTQTAAEEARRNVRTTLVGRLRELEGMADAARRLLALYHDTLIPQASLTLDSARASYGVGKVDFLTVLTAFTSALEYRVRSAETMATLYGTRAEMGSVLGESPLEWWGQQR